MYGWWLRKDLCLFYRTGNHPNVGLVTVNSKAEQHLWNCSSIFFKQDLALQSLYCSARRKSGHHGDIANASELVLLEFCLWSGQVRKLFSMWCRCCLYSKETKQKSREMMIKKKMNVRKNMKHEESHFLYYIYIEQICPNKSAQYRYPAEASSI